MGYFESHYSPQEKELVLIIIELSGRDYRFLLDLVYIGNWVLNSARENDRIEEYDALTRKIFSYCSNSELNALISRKDDDTIRPSRAYVDGGIHEVIEDYEDAVFFDILAEELTRRDMKSAAINPDDLTEFARRIDEYINEFERNGVDNITIDM